MELQLYEAIEPSFGGEPGTAQRVANALSEVPDGEELHVRINSPGGHVFEGFAVYNLLKESPARVVVHIDGLAGSIASVIAMAGDEVQIAANASIMIHNPFAAVRGDAAELRQQADALEQLQTNILKAYQAASKANGVGKTRGQLAKAMTAETYFTAREAKEWGLVTKIASAQKAAACADWDRYSYSEPPDWLRRPQRNDVPPAQGGEQEPAHPEPRLVLVQPKPLTHLA
jgi:ATP-dependent Clp endopeptidase proteolytic subunit ClpP